MTNLEYDVNATFDRIHATFVSLQRFNFEADLGSRVFSTLAELEDKYMKLNFTRLQLAYNITSDDFGNQHRLQQSLVENVKQYINSYRSGMLAYLESLQDLTENTQPIIKGYLHMMNESYYRYFFQGYLFSTHEIQECMDIVDKGITTRQESLNKLERQIDSAITDLEVMATNYKQESRMDTDFVLFEFRSSVLGLGMFGAL